MGAKAWEINNKVKVILTKYWIDVLKLLINTVKDSVLIKGDLRFKSGAAEDDATIIEILKKVEREILLIPEIKHISWHLTEWEKRGGKWVRKKEIKRKAGE
ncbi:MAG: hypothetical protein DRI36_05035 [Caldiserica bacterium]|nr:MAG: hypothetical protein DRI36_05035 [Caldisericota bacterium]